MNGTHEKNLVPSEKNLVNGKREIPLGTTLSKKIETLLYELYYDPTPGGYEELKKIISDMFSLMHHHRYGVLYNVLKKFI